MKKLIGVLLVFSLMFTVEAQNTADNVVTFSDGSGKLSEFIKSYVVLTGVDGGDSICITLKNKGLTHFYEGIFEVGATIDEPLAEDLGLSLVYGWKDVPNQVYFRIMPFYWDVDTVTFMEFSVELNVKRNGKLLGSSKLTYDENGEVDLKVLSSEKVGALEVLGGVFPNPFSNELRFARNAEVVEIYDLMGRVVYQGEGVDIVDTSSFLEGVYKVRYQNKGTWYNEILIK